MATCVICVCRVNTIPPGSPGAIHLSYGPVTSAPTPLSTEFSHNRRSRSKKVAPTVRMGCPAAGETRLNTQSWNQTQVQRRPLRWCRRTGPPGDSQALWPPEQGCSAGGLPGNKTDWEGLEEIGRLTQPEEVASHPLEASPASAPPHGSAAAATVDSNNRHELIRWRISAPIRMTTAN